MIGSFEVNGRKIGAKLNPQIGGLELYLSQKGEWWSNLGSTYLSSVVLGSFPSKLPKLEIPSIQPSSTIQPLTSKSLRSNHR